MLESLWHGYAREPLAALPGPTVEVRSPVAADRPILEADTGAAVDVPALARRGAAAAA